MLKLLVLWRRVMGETFVITGGAQGLGRALCLRASREGANVLVGDFNIEGARQTAAMIPNGVAVGMDVTDYDSCVSCMDTAAEHFGGIDVLVCNAGILLSGGIDDLCAKDWKRVVDVNLCGYYNTAKAAVKYLRRSEYASIIQINSKSGKKGSYKNSAYAASKFGGIGLTQSLALELAEDRIRVNAICPGNLLDSPLWVDSLYGQYAANQGISREEVRQKYIDQVPLKRGCEYEDVANMMVFLASRASSYMTGQAINVTGGQQMD